MSAHPSESQERTQREHIEERIRLLDEQLDDQTSEDFRFFRQSSSDEILLTRFFR